MSIERKSIGFEVKDLDTTKRTATIAHAVYGNVDRTKDISRKGMFTKSWNESKSDISFYLNHNDEQAPGKVLDVYETEDKAFTNVWLGTHTLGNDTLLMMQEGVIKNASFGYVTVKSDIITYKGQKVRELKEVKHIETSVLTKLPANPAAGVQSVVKSFMQVPELKTLSASEQQVLKVIAAGDMQSLQDLIGMAANLDPQSDLYMWVTWNISRRADMMGEVRSQLRYNAAELKEMALHVNRMEKFCRNTKASDDCIKSLLIDVEEAKQFLFDNNITTQADTKSLEPAADGWKGWFNN